MMNATQLVNLHVLHEQNNVIAELLKHGAIPDESLYGEWWEVLEWWLVTPFLAEQLQSEGEIIIAEHDCYWWGRQTSGQSIYMDNVIAEICSKFD